jgi:pimeloyl-ACP methyl ester carboxylesterase
MKKLLLLSIVCLACIISFCQEVTYPYPVRYFQLTIESQPVRMAYMDVAPAQANGQAIILFHGKNFNGFYWKDVIPYLTNAGYRVIVPDQVGWGQSDYPNIHYSFHLLAANNKQLLDSLGLRKVVVLGHSMGGMLATRFSLLYPDMVSKLVLEDPIGLEDYRTFVPYQSTDSLYQTELSATYESYKKYQQSYYPVWKPAYEPLVAAQAAALKRPDFDKVAWANALTYQMIYEQPVCYEFKNLQAKTLLVVGLEDRTIVGKNRVPKELVPLHGQYQLLGKQTKAAIPHCQLVELPGVGHIPHIQEPEQFRQVLMAFLAAK